MKQRTLILILAAALFAACTQAKLENDGADRQKQVSDIEDIQLKNLDEQIDSIAATLAAIDSTGSLMEGDISDLEEMESKFTAALESAKASVDKISSESGVTSDSALEAQIAEIQKRLEALEAQIEALREQIDSLKGSYNHLGDIIGDLTTISYIPNGADNTATVRYRVDSLAYVPDTLSLRFDLYSEDAANTVVAQWKSALSVKAVHTETKAQAGDMVNFEVVGASANDGILTVRVWPRKLDRSFIDGNLDVQISLVISSEKKKMASGYIQLISEVDDNEGFCWLVEFDTDNDGSLSNEELEAITELSLGDLYGKRYVSSNLIRQLLPRVPNLEKLHFVVYRETCSSLDFSKNPKLSDLYCYGDVQDINLSQNHNLSSLWLDGNEVLQKLPLSDCSNLSRLLVHDCSRLSELEIPNMPNLKELSVPRNLKKLNIDNDTALVSISGYGHMYGVLLHMSGIKNLSFVGTNFTSLDITNAPGTIEINAPQLVSLKVSGSLSVLDVSKFERLETLDCSNNKLTSLDVSRNVALTTLNCSCNPLTSLDISNNTSLTSLDINGTTLSSFRNPQRVDIIGQYVVCEGIKGVIFWDDDIGNIKIVSADETSATWDYYGTSTGATSNDDGVANTDKIASESSAAKWCRAKGAEWYLPALNELKVIYNNKSTLNATLSSIGGTQFGTSYYWSSTEYDRSHAYYLDFSSGSSDHHYKIDSGYVRAVRKL